MQGAELLASTGGSPKAVRQVWCRAEPEPFCSLSRGLFCLHFLVLSFTSLLILFSSLFVVSLSIPLLLQALLGGVASLLAFSSPGTFKCEMTGMTLRHAVVHF